jgi:ABC-type sugar transport system permease subunit
VALAPRDALHRGRPVRPAAMRARHHRRSLSRTQARAAWLFLLPSLLALAAFVLYPMGRELYLSFTSYDVLQAPRWIGLQNFSRLLQDPQAFNALKNTLVYACATTAVSVALALLVAILLNNRFPLRGLTRTAVFLPFITSLAVVALAWTYLLNPDIGLLSYWGSKIGINPGSGWLTNPYLAMVAVIIVGIWKYLGFYIVMYLAALQTIPRELYQAASIDGVGPIRRFTRVTWPLLANQTMFIAIIATITNMQAFDQIYVMTQGGPFFRTETLVMMMYRVGFTDLNFGYAAALSYVLVLILALLSFAQIGFFSRRTVRY